MCCQKCMSLECTFKDQVKMLPFILIAYFLSQLVNEAECGSNPLKYLDLPRQRESRRHEIEWIRWQVEQKCELGHMGQVRRLLNEASEVAERLVMQKPLEASSEDDGIKKDDRWRLLLSDYHRLPELWDLLDSLTAWPRSRLMCSSYGVELMLDFLKIWGGPGAIVSAKGVVKRERKLFDYLRVFSLEHYNYCLKYMAVKKKTVEKMEENVGSIEGMFDTVFTNYQIKLDDSKRDEKILQQVSKVNLQSSGNEDSAKLDFEQMFNGAFGRSKRDNSKKAQVEQLMRWLEENCKQFRFHVGNTFDSYNFGRLLLPEVAAEAISNYGPEDSVKFLKLNEYSRICQQVEDPQRRDNIQKNLIDRAEKISWFKKIFKI